jgi:hypothetical protein
MFQPSMLFAGCLALSLCATGFAFDLNADPKPNDDFYARGIGYPLQNRERVFRPGVKRANFTFLHGTDNADVREGRLVFTLAGATATLGWGNYLSKQPVAEVEDMGQQTIIVRLKVRQSAGRSQWTAALWRDGQRLEQQASVSLEGRDWQELQFPPLRSDGANADGLEFTVQGDQGSRVELEWLKLIQPTCEGYCRHEFVLPEGKVWRAVADVGSANHRNWMGVDEMASRLYINGTVVKRKGASHLYQTDGVDIAPYLKPGRNCVGFYGFRIGHAPFIYFQARIIMTTGEVVTVASGPDWTSAAEVARSGDQPQPGWSEPGFDDSGWIKAQGGSAPQGGLPTYSGRLLLKNPARRDLFYTDAADVVVDVHAPASLQARQPTLAYLFGRADSEGHCQPVKQGTVAAFAEQGDSLVYRLNLGRHDRGVYAVALSLQGKDGVVIEERCREPLVVLRKMRLKAIVGHDYVEGLDLQLEDTIDFTNPRDPHPWHESRSPARMIGQVAGKVDEPTIVRRGGLAYREVTDPKRGSGFSYRVQFQRPGSFYYLEMEYPDDAQRVIEVSISSKTQGVWTNSQSGVGAETGGRFLPTGTLQKLCWIHVADPGPHSVDVINVVDNQRAAAKSLKVYRIRGDLPSVGAGVERRYGIHTERCFYTSGVGMNFGVGQPKNRESLRADQQLPSRQLFLKDLVWLQETAERYAQYLQFCGQNCFVMGCIQYSEYNTPYVPAPWLDDSRVLHCMKTMLANVLDTNGVDFYAGVEFSQPQDVRTYANNAQVAKGADTVWMVDSKGEQRYGHRLTTIVPNWLHPAVRGWHNQLLLDLGRTFGHLSHWRGIHGLVGPSQRAGYWIPAFGGGSLYGDFLDASLDDLTMGLFAKESGIELPIPASDPQRFAKRAAVLRNPQLQQRFLDWRGDKVRDFYAEAVQTLRRNRTAAGPQPMRCCRTEQKSPQNCSKPADDCRKDVEVINALAVEDREFFKYLVASGKSFQQVMRDYALDLDKLCAVDGLRTGRWTLSWRQTAPPLPTQDPYCWLARTRPDVISAFAGPSQRYVLARTSWDENMFPTGGHMLQTRDDHDRLVESDWIMNAARIRALPQPGGYHCREALIQALITGDPDLLLSGFTDININVGHEQMLRSVLKTYTHLPRERFTPVLNTGLDTNLAIRRLTRGNESFFYVANPCQWHVRGRVTLETDGQVFELVSGNRVELAGQQLAVSLTPFGLTAYRVSSPKLVIGKYQTDPLAGDELARLEGLVNRVAGLLAHPQAKLSLSSSDRHFMNGAVAQARQAIAGREYARAWAFITHHRFWSLWRDFLEQAAARAALLPDSVVAAASASGIRYDAERNCICVTGYPEDAPATMDAILAADRKNGWGKVTYDKATDTHTVNAALWIGDDKTDGTFLQLGDTAHPRLTVVVNGTVWVRPPRESAKRSDGLESVINRLTLGSPDGETIRATLKIACQTPGQHGVYVGYRSPDSKTWAHGGSLHVHNSTITALTQDRQHVWGPRDYTDEQASPRWASPGWYASDVRLVNATLSWFEGCPTYGIQTGTRASREPVDTMQPNPRMLVVGTTFEHGGSAVQNGLQYLQNCVFRDLQTAVSEGGSLSAKLVHCTFEGNQSNWTLGSMQSGGIVLDDCLAGNQKTPLTIRKNGVAPEQAIRAGVPLYPACLERRSLQVKVVDAAGQPVPEALVVVSGRADAPAVTRGATLTDQNGLTASGPGADAVVIAVKRHQATDNPAQPKTETFGYEVAVTKPGFQSRTVQLAGGKPIPIPLVIELGRQLPDGRVLP